VCSSDLSPNFSRSLMKIKSMFPGNYSQHHVVIFEIEIVSFPSISRDYISLQALCQIFVDRPA
jgi:hypothetical protein